jgi:hypothetical protein
MKYAIVYSTDKRLFRQNPISTDRWKPSSTMMELREKPIICAGQNIKPKYDYSRVIRRSK